MPTERYILQADVDSMLTAQRAIIVQQTRMMQEMKKGSQATKEMHSDLGDFAKGAVQDLKNIVFGWVSVQEAISIARDLVGRFRRDMEQARQAGQQFTAALGPLYATNLAAVPEAKALRGLAVGAGIAPGPMVEAFGALAGAEPRRDIRGRLMREAVEMWQPLKGQVSLTEAAMGLQTLTRATGISPEQAQNLAMYLLQQAPRGGLGPLTEYGGRAMGAMVGAGASPEEAAGLFVTAAQRAGIGPEMAGQQVPMIWEQVNRAQGQGWRRFGVVPGGGMENFRQLAAAYAAGNLTNAALANLVGPRQATTLRFMLQNWGVAQQQIELAGQAMGPATDLGAAALNAYLTGEPLAREQLATARVAAQRGWETAAGPLGVTAERVATFQEAFGMEMEEAGGGWGKTVGALKTFMGPFWWSGAAGRRIREIQRGARAVQDGEPSRTLEMTEESQ